MRLAIDPDLEFIYAWEESWRAFYSDYGIDRGQSRHWRWDDKAIVTLLSRAAATTQAKMLAILSDDQRCHGMMKLRWPAPSRLALAGAVHIEYLEVAPWNRFGIGLREIDGVGALLVYHAIVESERHGYAGRVNLASLPQSVDFYARLGFARCGKGTGNSRGLPFFEREAGTAEEFRASFRIRSAL